MVPHWESADSDTSAGLCETKPNDTPYLRPSLAIRSIAFFVELKIIVSVGTYLCASSQTNRIGRASLPRLQTAKSNTARDIIETTTLTISDGTPERSIVETGLLLTGKRRSSPMIVFSVSLTSMPENIKPKRGMVSKSQDYPAYPFLHRENASQKRAYKELAYQP